MFARVKISTYSLAVAANSIYFAMKNNSMSSRFIQLAMVCCMLSSCQFQCSMGDKKTVEGKTVSSGDPSELTGATIKNNIDVEAKGVKLAQAYLMDENRAWKESNTAALNEKIYLTLKLDTGWTKIDGKSFIGASERVTDKNGVVVLDSDDLFKDYDTSGMPSDIASLVNLSAVISKLPSSGVTGFTVKFKVWDKKGSGEVSGTYDFTIK